jgi:hypothetical protein
MKVSMASSGLPRAGDLLEERFEILGVLGEGGMGHVFWALDVHVGQEIALKLIVPRYRGRPEREERFLRELELGRRMERHPHLVTMIDGGRLGSSAWPFLVMELVLGKALANQLALGPLRAPMATRIARQVAGAVRALHRSGVVHRDITPMNVLVHRSEAVLIDLSHAGDAAAPRLPVGHSGRLTRENEVPGSHPYVPPEQARSEPARPAMDVFAFGVTLADMLIGLTTDNYSREVFLELQRAGKLKPPRIDTRVYTSVPRALAELVEACTALEAGERPTMDEVVARLDDVLASMGMPAEVSTPAVAGSQPEDDLELEPLRTTERGMARRAWLAALAVMAAVLAVAALAWWWSTDGATKDVPQTREPEVPSPPLPMTREELGVEAPKLENTPAVPTPTPVPRKVKPKTKAKAKAKPMPAIAPEEPSPAEGDECIALRGEVEQAAASAAWAKVAKLTRRRECWGSQAERRRLRVRALFETQAWDDCVDEGQDVTEPQVRQWVDLCQRHVD